MTPQRTFHDVRLKRRNIVQRGFLSLPIFLLCFLSLGMRFWWIGGELFGKGGPDAVTNSVIADNARTFCRKIIGSPGAVLEMFPPNPMTRTPFWTVRCATDLGDYSIMLTPDGETLTVASEWQVVTKPSGASLPSAQIALRTEAEAKERIRNILLDQKPDRIRSRHIKWREFEFWEMSCRCPPCDNAVRTYRIQVEARTGRLCYFNLKVDRQASKLSWTMPDGAERISSFLRRTNESNESDRIGRITSLI